MQGSGGQQEKEKGDGGVRSWVLLWVSVLLQGTSLNFAMPRMYLLWGRPAHLLQFDCYLLGTSNLLLHAV